jgi:hypothetical protein
MKILVCGDRNWKDDIKMNQVFRTLPNDIILVHGDCRGADQMSAKIGKKFGFKVIAYPAKWNIYGKGAGPIRNQQMLDENPDIDLVLAFHNGIESSKGTKDMIQRADKKGIKYKLITSKTELI